MELIQFFQVHKAVFILFCFLKITLQILSINYIFWIKLYMEVDIDMAIKWTPNLSVGVESIDSQHIKWFEKANDLFQAGKSGKSNEVIAEMFDFLDDYTKEHFRDEEAYMAKIKYPGLDQQKIAHRKFLEELARLKKDYQQSGGNIALIVNANQMIINWLTQHISNMDKQIGVYAKTL
jgi:hemerythrin